MKKERQFLYDLHRRRVKILPFLHLFQQNKQLRNELFQQYLKTDLKPDYELFLGSHYTEKELKKGFMEARNRIPLSRIGMASFVPQTDFESSLHDLKRKYIDLSTKDQLPEEFKKHSIEETVIIKRLKDLQSVINDFNLQACRIKEIQIKEYAEAFATHLINLLQKLNNSLLIKLILEDFIAKQQCSEDRIDFLIDNKIDADNAKRNYRQLTMFASNIIHDYLKTLKVENQYLIKAPKVKALFRFIEYLHSNIENFNQYNNLIEELEQLDRTRNQLKPLNNYKDKQQYDKVQAVLESKFKILQDNTANLIKTKARKLNVCNFDNEPNYNFNGVETEINQLKDNFNNEDLPEIFKHKSKYLKYRSQTHGTFLSLQFFFDELDKLTKSLFDFFKDNDQNENEIKIDVDKWSISPDLVLKSKEELREHLKKTHRQISAHEIEAVIDKYHGSNRSKLVDTAKRKVLAKQFAESAHSLTLRKVVAERLTIAKTWKERRKENIDDSNTSFWIIDSLELVLNQILGLYKLAFSDNEKAIAQLEAKYLFRFPRFIQKLANDVSNVLNQEMIKGNYELAVKRKRFALFELNIMKQFLKNNHGIDLDKSPISEVLHSFVEALEETLPKKDENNLIIKGNAQTKTLPPQQSKKPEPEIIYWEMDVENEKMIEQFEKAINNIVEKTKIKDDLGCFPNRFRILPQVILNEDQYSTERKKYLLKKMFLCLETNKTNSIIDELLKEFLLIVEPYTDIYTFLKSQLQPSEKPKPELNEALISFSSPEIIECLHNELKGYFQGKEAELKKALQGEQLQEFLLFPHNQNKFVEVFKRLKYNGFLLSTPKETKDWICSTFTYKYQKGNKKEVREFNTSTVHDILTKDKGEPTKKERICVVDWLPYKSHSTRQKEAEKENA